ANVGNPQTDSDGVAPGGVFTHIAVSYDDSTGTAKFYFNGVLTNVRSTTTGQLASTTGLSVGTWLNSRWFAGTIDELYVYNRVLTGGEIAAFVPAASLSSDPLLVYDMENLTADGKMKDLSGNGNHGTVFGTTRLEEHTAEPQSLAETGGRLLLA